jgi:hypothetical protein
VRSDIQFMIDLFKDSNNEKFNDVFNMFKEDELLENFDSSIKYGKEHIEFTVKKQDMPVLIAKQF